MFSAEVVFHLDSVSQDAIPMRPWSKRKFLHTVTTWAVKIRMSQWETCWNFEVRKKSRVLIHNWLKKTKHREAPSLWRQKGRADVVLVTTGSVVSNGLKTIRFTAIDRQACISLAGLEGEDSTKGNNLKCVQQTWFVGALLISKVQGRDENAFSKISLHHLGERANNFLCFWRKQQMEQPESPSCDMRTAHKELSSSPWGRGRGKPMDSPSQHFPVHNQTLENSRIPCRNFTWRATLLTPNGESGTCDSLASQNFLGWFDSHVTISC